MATAPDDRRRFSSPHDAVARQLKVSDYDRVASLLVSLLVIVGLAVVLLLLVWLMTRRQLARPQATIAVAAEASGGEGDIGEEQGFEEPNATEVQDLIDVPFEQTLASMNPEVGQTLANMPMLASGGAGAGGGLDRGPGGGGSADVVPRWLRWVIRYTSNNPQEYARQLDFFGVELAATSPELPNIEYVSQLTASSPTRRSGPAADEQRLFMRWQAGPLQNADAEILRGAGVDIADRTIVQYYPNAVAQDLAKLEAAHAEDQPLEQIRKTVFGVRSTNGRYEYYVLEQQFRAGAVGRSAR